MAEMAQVLIGRLLIVANTSAPVPPDEWTASVREIAAHAKQHWTREPRVLVFTEGGGPDSVQRRAMFDAVPQIRLARGAVVSSNALIRGVATAFSWFTGGFKVFPPSALREGLAWLELDEDEGAQVSRAIARIKRELGEDRVRSIPRAV
jgi:hypothetical protein